MSLIQNLTDLTMKLGVLIKVQNNTNNKTT